MKTLQVTLNGAVVGTSARPTASTPGRWSPTRFREAEFRERMKKAAHSH
jgi:hypothetical protein